MEADRRSPQAVMLRHRAAATRAWSAAACGAALWLALLLCLVLPVHAAAPGLTPVGAERAGNAAGSIPAWTGGAPASAGGWQPGRGIPDPFADERPLFRVDASNLAAHAAQLAPGLRAVLLRQPRFAMPVYPAHRTAVYRARGDAAPATASPVPFPEPRDGLEAITNHLLRPLGGGIERRFDSFVVRPGGGELKVGFHERRVYDANFDQPMPGRLFSYFGEFLAPADLVGTIYLAHEPDPRGVEERRAWIYNAGQRRVRRAPDFAYDNGQDGSDGMAVVDQYDGYNGRPDRYDWQLLGKRELLVPYNNHGIADKRIAYADIVRKGSPNPDLLRFELHRVWVVEARLKPGVQHVYARRVFYLDEDSWAVLLSEAWDARGELWRVGLHSLAQFAEAGVPWYRFELWFDLSNGSYLLTGLDNEYDTPWRFDIHGRAADFQPDALRRAGR